MKNYYAIFDERKNGCIYDSKVFTSKKKAIEEAKRQWNYLTEREKKNDCVYFAVLKGEKCQENGYIDMDDGLDIVYTFKARNN